MNRIRLWVIWVGLATSAAVAWAQTDVHVPESEADEPPPRTSRPKPGPEPDWPYLEGPGSERRYRRSLGRDAPERFGPRPPRPFERGKFAGPGGPGRGRYGRFFEPEQERRVLEFVKEHFPNVWERIEKQRRGNMEKFRYTLREFGPAILRLMDAMSRNPELGKVMMEDYKLELEIRDLIRRYHAEAATSDEKDSLKSQLRELLARQFDVRQQRRKLEIEALQKRIDEQKKRIQERERNKQALIDSELFRRLNPDEQW